MSDPVATALEFVGLFPECQAWDAVLLDQQKKRVDGGQYMSTTTLRSKLPLWMAWPTHHIFVRPLLGNLVFIDLDGFEEAGASSSSCTN